MEQVKLAGLNAIVNLTQAAIAQQRRRAEVKPRDEKRGREGARKRVAQASLAAHLIRMDGDDEPSIPSSPSALDRAPAAGVQPASHRGSPRIAADPCGCGHARNRSEERGSASPGTRGVRPENP